MASKFANLHVDSKCVQNPNRYAITQKAYKVENVGKTVKSSKKKVTWVFGCYTRTHQVELHDSIASGKKRLVVDGKTVFQTEIKDAVFSHMVAINNVDVQISKKKTIMGPDQYILKIDNILFQELRMSSPRVKGSPAPVGPGQKVAEYRSPRNSPTSKLRSTIVTVAETQVTAQGKNAKDRGGIETSKTLEKVGNGGAKQEEEEEKEKEEEEEEEEEEDRDEASSRVNRSETTASFNPFDDDFNSAPEMNHAKHESTNLLDFANFTEEPKQQHDQFAHFSSSSSAMEKGRPEHLNVGQQSGMNNGMLFSPTGYGSQNEVQMGMQQHQSQASPCGTPNNQLPKQHQHHMHIHGAHTQIPSPQHNQHPSLQAYQSPRNHQQQQHQQFSFVSPANMSPIVFNSSLPSSPPSRSAPKLASPMNNSNVSHASKMEQLRMMMAAAPSTFHTNTHPQRQQQLGSYDYNNSNNNFGSNNNGMLSPNSNSNAFNDIDAFSHISGDDVKPKNITNTNISNNMQTNNVTNVNMKTDYSFESNGSPMATAIPTGTPTNNNNNNNNHNQPAVARFNPFD